MFRTSSERSTSVSVPQLCGHETTRARQCGVEVVGPSIPDGVAPSITVAAPTGRGSLCAFGFRPFSQRLRGRPLLPGEAACGGDADREWTTMSGQPVSLHDGVADVHGLVSSDVEIYHGQGRNDRYDYP